MTPAVEVGEVRIGGAEPLALIAGPCVIESLEVALETAEGLKQLCAELSLPLVYKSSFDKANRSSIDSYRGPGLEEGLTVLAEVKAQTGLPVLTDVHEPGQAAAVAEVADVLQVPAFLCRQTDLLLAVAQTMTPVNIKKGQFMAPADMRGPVEKVRAAGNERVMVTERGFAFGYNRLVVDMAGLALMRELGCPLVFDATHSVQLPAAAGTASGGERDLAPVLARAAAAVGIDALFLEVHPRPEQAKCDGPNMLYLDSLRHVLEPILAIHRVGAEYASRGEA
ncbi:MAG: 3-deoxy-8-phosphooctulonate synthase [Armatimonadota bacterium]